MRNIGLSRRAIGCVALTFFCVAIVVLAYGAQTSVARSPQDGEKVTIPDDSTLPVLPLLWLLLPVAAVAAYFLERTGAHSSL
jgi:hypothetical protein